MAGKSDGEPIRPPYLAWETFANFLSRLKTTTIPNQIDGTVLPHTLSGSSRAQLISALRFLDLISADGTVTDKLRKLVQTYDTEKWRDESLPLLMDPYDDIINGLEIDSATPKQLDERFDQIGLPLSMRQKCIRFYLAAIRSAGAMISPYLLQRRKRTNSGKSAPRRRKDKAAEDNNDDHNVDRRTPVHRQHQPPAPPQGMIAFPIHMPNRPQGSIVVPADLKKSDLPLVRAAMMMAEAYAEANSDE